jgi:hypothetical protein
MNPKLNRLWLVAEIVTVIVCAFFGCLLLAGVFSL